jgi:hypothetical protein
MSPINNNSHQHQYQHQQQRRHRQASMPPPMWQTLQLPSSQDLSKRQRASTMNDHQFPTITPSINVLSPTHLQPPEIEQDYFTFISAQHNQPSSPPPINSNVPEIRLAVAPTITPDARSLHSLAPPSVISDYDLFVSARQSFELSPSSAAIASIATPSFHKHLADHIMTSGMAHESLLLESPSLLETLFPTLQDWNQKSLFSKLSALAALPLVFIFTLTLPVAEINQIKVNDIEVIDDYNDDNGVDDQNEERTINYLSVPTAAAAAAAISASDHDLPAKCMVDDIDTKQGWNKQLLMIQCIISTVFILTVFAGNIKDAFSIFFLKTKNIFILANEVIPFIAVIAGIFVGILMIYYIHKSTTRNEPPSWFWMLSFVGFFVALNWIFLLANEVVGLLQAIGHIFSISDAIMGLTVFALVSIYIMNIACIYIYMY